MKFRLPNPFGRPFPIRTPLPGFDPRYYLHWYPDVRATGLSPLRHYLDRGWREGRDPSAGFSTSGYLAANPDVAAAGHNPLIHFVNVGFSEGRGGYAKDPHAPAPLPGRAGDPPGPPPPQRASVPGPRQGDLNDADLEGVRGWALGAVAPSAPAEIEIFVDRFLVGTTIADLYRQDLEKDYGDPHHGFLYTFSPPLKPFASHGITARRAVDRLVIGHIVLPGRRYDPPTRG